MCNLLYSTVQYSGVRMGLRHAFALLQQCISTCPSQQSSHFILLHHHHLLLSMRILIWWEKDDTPHFIVIYLGILYADSSLFYTPVVRHTATISSTLTSLSAFEIWHQSLDSFVCNTVYSLCSSSFVYSISSSMDRLGFGTVRPDSCLRMAHSSARWTVRWDRIVAPTFLKPALD